MNNIRVFVRCRPLREHEKGPCLQVDEDRAQIRVNENRSFQFDDVFSPVSTQIDIYMIVVSPLVHDLLLGYNCSVFAYGPTGTGKTFTMEGETFEQMDSWEANSLCGIIPRTISQLFETLEDRKDRAEVKVSFLELYNEEAYDLLSPIEDTRKLKIYDNGPKQIVDGLRELTVKNRQDLYQILKQGCTKRATASTQLNARSSRSHTIFTIHLCTSEGKQGRINLIDLAGSENIGRSGAQDIRAREAGSINQSLLTLGRVIKALVDKAPHIPYRESKLTRLLQNSLGGSTKTSMIATISPSLADLEDTLNTLEYATRAKGVTNKIVMNQSILNVSSNHDIIESLKLQLVEQEYKIRNEVAKEYRKESENVKQYYEQRYNGEINDLNQQVRDAHQEIGKLKGEVVRMEKTNNELTQQVKLAQEEVDRLKTELLKADNLKDSYENRYSAETINLNQQVIDAHKEIDKLKTELLKADNLKEFYENRYNVETDNLNQKVMDAHQEIDKLKGELLKAHDEIDKLRDMPQSQCSPITTPKLGPKKATRVKKNLLDASGDYANVTFDNEDEIAGIGSVRKGKKVIVACAKKREINQAITLSGKKRKLQSQDDQVELSPVVCKRVTRSRKKLVY